MILLLRFFILTIVLTLIGCGHSNEPERKPPGILSAAEYAGVGFLDTTDAVCTGTLISARIVLTAGHCVIGRKASQLHFTLSPEPLKVTDSAYADAIRVAIHPQYNDKEETPGVDVAAIQLSSPTYDYAVTSFLALGSEQGLVAGSPLWNIGYGENWDGSHALKRAKEVSFQDLTELVTLTALLPKGLVQVARGRGGEIGCGGDSGSPLIRESPSGPAIIGVYSTSEGSANKRAPEKSDCRHGITTGYYIAVDSFKAWVEHLNW